MACRMVASDSASSCGPHPNDQPPPPTAHEPNPTLVISSPLVPSGRVASAIVCLLGTACLSRIVPALAPCSGGEPCCRAAVQLCASGDIVCRCAVPPA